MKLIFIIDGTETTVFTTPETPISIPVQQALKQTGNDYVPLPEWQLIYNEGTLNWNKTVGEQVENESTLFLSTTAGTGRSKNWKEKYRPKRAMESDTAAREGNLDLLLTLIMVRHFAAINTSDEELKAVYLQSRDSAVNEVKFRFKQLEGEQP